MPPNRTLRSKKSNAAPVAAENLMPAILAAVEAYATVGEISDALRRAFGEYRNPSSSDDPIAKLFSFSLLFLCASLRLCGEGRSALSSLCSLCLLRVLCVKFFDPS